MDLQRDTAGMAVPVVKDDADLSRRRKNHKRTKPQLLMRSELDGRCNSAKFFDKMVAEITADLAGADQRSAIERALIEGFVGAATVLQNLNTRLALGQEIDLSEHAQAVSAMCRVAVWASR